MPPPHGVSEWSKFSFTLFFTIYIRPNTKSRERKGRKRDPKRATNNLQNSYLFTQAMTRRGVAGRLHTRVEGYNLGPILTWFEKCIMNEVKPENKGGVGEGGGGVIDHLSSRLQAQRRKHACSVQ